MAGSKGRVAWRDTFAVWPSLRIEVQVAPWHWRLRWYRDDIEPYWVIDLGPLRIDFGANREWFPLERRTECLTPPTCSSTYGNR